MFIVLEFVADPRNDGCEFACGFEIERHGGDFRRVDGYGVELCRVDS